MEKTFQGVVIKEAPSGENGKILHVLTENMGVVRVSATGARKLSTSYVTCTQLFSYSVMTVNEKNGYMILKEAKLIENFHNIRNSLSSLAFASYACEMALIASTPEDSNFLRLCLNALYATANDIKPVPIIKAVFELKLCCISGMTPDITADCCVCGSKACGFAVRDGEMRCKEHMGDKNSFITLDKASLELISFVCDSDFSRMLSFKVSPDSAADFCIFTEAFALYMFDIKPKTLQFYHQISNL